MTLQCPAANGRTWEALGRIPGETRAVAKGLRAEALPHCFLRTPGGHWTREKSMATLQTMTARCIPGKARIPLTLRDRGRRPSLRSRHQVTLGSHAPSTPHNCTDMYTGGHREIGLGIPGVSAKDLEGVQTPETSSIGG